LLLLLGQWGIAGDATSDIDASGMVDVDDLLLLIVAWGPCSS
jgi:hypothetical protein